MYRLQPPEELVFKGPFTDYVSQKLKIENTGDSPIGFKVKTTTPKKFSVKPNMGCIEAHGSQDITICLHSFTYDPNDKTRHKFMVQVVGLTATTDTQAVEAMIKDYERNNPTKLKESKLKVAIVPSQSEVERQSMSTANANVYHSATPNQQYSAPFGGPLANLNNQQIPSLEDFRQLEADISSLRSENSQLKEENAYQRKQISELERGGGSSSGSGGASGNGSSSQVVQPESNGGTMQRMLFLIAVLFLGAIMGFYMGQTRHPSRR
ncbi:vesicle-associated membrane protein-associated protein A-like [Convolutriloba macropyga]|uniref:vesicle-associated membrane protein-associated protein A-like n=1 Tax=Convolutriloba macropyga TaxID=536237 RepID=UPI003F520B51